MAKKLLIFCLLTWISLFCKTLFADQTTPIPSEQAFAFSANIHDEKTLELSWKIAGGYYLYKDRFAINAVNAEIQVEPLPEGIAKEDDILGKYQVYQDQLSQRVTLAKHSQETVKLLVSYQGCARWGFCYPPVQKQINVDFTPTGIVLSSVPVEASISSASETKAKPKLSDYLTEQSVVTQFLQKESIVVILAGFFIFGLLLSFTPCVLPMIPILSTIILGQDKTTTFKAFTLSITYVLAMAATYAFAGVASSYLGHSIQATLQKPWIIITFSGFFIFLALAMFDVFKFHLPAKWQHYIHDMSNQHQGGTYVGVAMMGCLSTLVLSPCVTAPLVGALTYIAQTGNSELGGPALFIMGLGMGVPLLIIGTTSGRWLPKTGPWMHATKIVFGIFMLAVAAYMLGRIVSARINLLLWAFIFIVAAAYLGAFHTLGKKLWHKIAKGFGILSFAFSIVLIISAIDGGDSPFKSLIAPQTPSNETTAIPFKRIKTIDDLNSELALAHKSNRPVLLDFYADWCIACKQIERQTFQNPDVQKAFKQWNVALLQADISANDAEDQALSKHMDVFAPPAILLFKSNNLEGADIRIVGEVGPSQLIEKMTASLSSRTQ